MDKAKEFREWIKYAEADLQTAELLNSQHRKSLHIICFHCQQAAEKYLKAFLVSRNISFEKIHDLVYLHKLCISINEDFSKIVKDCLKLNPYAVVARYPSELELIEQDAVSALASALVIKKFVMERTDSCI